MSDEKGCPSTLKSLWQELGAPVVVAIIVGIGSGALAAWSALVRMDTQLTKMEEKTASHEQQVNRDLARQSVDIAAILKRIEEDSKIMGDHEKRIVRLEAQTTVLQTMLEEVRTDVKTLLKSMSIK